ncbi:hypothetical protein PRK78_002684 [Emydomyces testavorans]|uniref:Calcipressin n=1 Tax=Emydomyces testavorans TaxID=2070801 RepID=A0AAF0IHU1_9EURO|nr:hypothetical protein PRK78_002684 [Emydomyces testavorans]
MSAPASPTPTSLAARRASSTSSSRTILSLDLSSLPQLPQPSPPSNTLLITDLHNLKLFQPDSLAQIKSRITAIAPLNSFSPLPSLRRIVCSFYTIDAAIQVRQSFDNSSAILGNKVQAKVYFGEHTPVEDVEVAKKRKLLEAPQVDKLFFISPPPSPPHGWILRNEEPPNKEVHASDLVEALNRLGRSNSTPPVMPETPGSIADVPMQDVGQESSRTSSKTTTAFPSQQRSRSSTLIYHPEEHGRSPNLPAVMVEDTSIDPGTSDSETDISPIEGSRRILAHTSRPPVELMR